MEIHLHRPVFLMKCVKHHKYLMRGMKNSITVGVSKIVQADNDFQLRCQIIEEVKERLLLYNKGHSKYQINSVQAKEFTHMGVAVGKTSEYNVDIYL